jgi:predicted peroxiredoxin
MSAIICIAGVCMRYLMIVVTTLDMEKSEAIVAVFNRAKAAAAEFDVEVILTGESGVIATIHAVRSGVEEEHLRLLYDSMRSAKSVGVKISICERSMEWCGLNNDELIPEIDYVVSSQYIIERAAPNTYVAYL